MPILASSRGVLDQPEGLGADGDPCRDEPDDQRLTEQYRQRPGCDAHGEDGGDLFEHPELHVAFSAGI